MITLPRAARQLALPVAIICLASLPVRAEERPDRIAALVERTMRPLLAEHDVPGLAIAGTAGGRQRFFSFGIASRETRQPVSEHTLFEIGSVSKAFTATLGAYAEVQGRLSLGDRPSRFMPSLAGGAIDRASLLHLATYTAGGLPLQFPATVRNGTMIDYFRAWQPAAAPGAQRRYSNPSIGLFGHLAAAAMGRPFADLMERDVFPKLGLRDSHIRVPQAAMARYAMGYNRQNRPTRVSVGLALLGAEAYGVKTSAADLIRFVEANIRPETLEPAMRRAVEATQVGHFRVGEMVQGLGWEQYPWPVTLERLLAGNATTMAMDAHPATAITPPLRPAGPALFNKTGSTSGFGAYVAVVPQKRIGIVVLANRALPIPARIAAAHAVLEALAAGAP
nr:class C beta-lactamase [Phreatobacter sp.]